MTTGAFTHSTGACGNGTAGIANRFGPHSTGARLPAQIETDGVHRTVDMEANLELQATLETEGWITVARAAGMLAGVRPQTVYRWVVTKRVAQRWVGGLLFVSRADVQKVLGVKEAEVERDQDDEKQTCRWQALNVGGHMRCTPGRCLEEPRRTRQEHEQDHADDDDGRGER